MPSLVVEGNDEVLPELPQIEIYERLGNDARNDVGIGERQLVGRDHAELVSRDVLVEVVSECFEVRGSPSGCFS